MEKDYTKLKDEIEICLNEARYSSPQRARAAVNRIRSLNLGKSLEIKAEIELLLNEVTSARCVFDNNNTSTLAYSVNKEANKQNRSIVNEEIYAFSDIISNEYNSDKIIITNSDDLDKFLLSSDIVSSKDKSSKLITNTPQDINNSLLKGLEERVISGKSCTVIYDLKDFIEFASFQGPNILAGGLARRDYGSVLLFGRTDLVDTYMGLLRSGENFRFDSISCEHGFDDSNAMTTQLVDRLAKSLEPYQMK